jgi:DNA invertase Pin-like site-specific DNA recombinase
MNPKSEIRNPKSAKVVGYVRGSTEEQQNTLEAQENQIRAYCAYKGLDLVKVYIESGESGSVSFYERPVAAEMLSAIGNRNLSGNLESKNCSDSKTDSCVPASLSDISGIVITKLDRGFRNALDCLFTLDNLAARGIGLHLLDIQLEPDTPVGKLLVTMLAAIAEFENKRRSERQVAAFAVMKSKGLRCGTIPYGWELSTDSQHPNSLADSNLRKSVQSVDGFLVPNEEEQRVLRQIVQWIETDRYGISKIARLLNNAGTPTKQGGKKWYPATVRTVYEHRRLTAEHTEDTEKAA